MGNGLVVALLVVLVVAGKNTDSEPTGTLLLVGAVLVYVVASWVGEARRRRRLS